ncbi:hypothetical protein QM334_35130, partial [Burkholderia cenocepacia]|nr:hypothetical protein [Burkholderia cenocepacia]
TPAGALVWTMPKPVAPEAQAANAPKIVINDIMPILQQRCVECHSAKPTLMGSAPAGRRRTARRCDRGTRRPSR